MMISTKKANARIEALFTELDNCGCNVSIHNAKTGEVLKPDTTAIFAGIQAGLLAATELLEHPINSTTDKESVIAATLKTASKIYLRRHENRFDEIAAEVAAAAESEGADNA